MFAQCFHEQRTTLVLLICRLKCESLVQSYLEVYCMSVSYHTPSYAKHRLLRFGFYKHCTFIVQILYKWFPCTASEVCDMSQSWKVPQLQLCRRSGHNVEVMLRLASRGNVDCEVNFFFFKKENKSATVWIQFLFTLVLISNVKSC